MSEKQPLFFAFIKFSLSESPSLSNKDSILTTTLFFVHPSQGNAYSPVEYSSHASLCCTFPYENKLSQLEKFKLLSIASRHTMEIFKKKTSLLLDKVAQCLLPLEEEHITSRWEITPEQQPQEISVHWDSWDQLNNQFRIKEETAGRT